MKIAAIKSDKRMKKKMINNSSQKMRSNYCLQSSVLWISIQKRIHSIVSDEMREQSEAIEKKCWNWKWFHSWIVVRMLPTFSILCSGHGKWEFFLFWNSTADKRWQKQRGAGFFSLKKLPSFQLNETTIQRLTNLLIGLTLHST